RGAPAARRERASAPPAAGLPSPRPSAVPLAGAVPPDRQPDLPGRGRVPRRSGPGRRGRRRRTDAEPGAPAGSGRSSPRPPLLALPLREPDLAEGAARLSVAAAGRIGVHAGDGAGGARAGAHGRALRPPLRRLLLLRRRLR